MRQECSEPAVVLVVSELAQLELAHTCVHKCNAKLQQIASTHSLGTNA